MIDELNRRQVLAVAGGLAVSGATAFGLRAALGARAPAAIPKHAFTLGVASGEPSPDGAVLWTRLAPVPLAGGGMPDREVEVHWEVANDSAFARPVQRGTTRASPAWAHSIHLELVGLEPDRYYWYRFRVAETTELSAAGRFRTAPALGADKRKLRWAVTACQDWQAGLYTLWRDVAEQDVAFVAFLGDYIYETAARATNIVRRHEGTGEPITLAQYRNRYAQYHGDPDLQAAHAAHAFVASIDDHEVHNNWANYSSANLDPAALESFRRRRAAALQAYWEHMPLRFTARPVAGFSHLYRRLHFGRLATVSVLETRQLRSAQPTSEQAANDPALTMTGSSQERWLLKGLAGSSTHWNLLANQTMMAENLRPPVVGGPARAFDFDNWDGYRTQRERVLTAIGAAKVPNVVVLTGDRHATWISDLKPDFGDPRSPVVAAELTATSLTSEGNPDVDTFHAQYDPIMAESPHWKFIDDQRGYLVCTADRDQLSTDLRAVSTVWAPGGTVSRYASFVTESGHPGVSVDSVAATPVAVPPPIRTGSE
jgi:alkaline phosphatase D